MAHAHQVALPTTTKVPPEYDGITSWFEYDDAVLDWNAYTELQADAGGLSLKARLKGYAADLAVYFSNAAERQKLCEPDHGFNYFLKTMRGFLVKGTLEVFLYSFI